MSNRRNQGGSGGGGAATAPPNQPPVPSVSVNHHPGLNQPRLPAYHHNYNPAVSNNMFTQQPHQFNSAPPPVQPNQPPMVGPRPLMPQQGRMANHQGGPRMSQPGGANRAGGVLNGANGNGGPHSAHVGNGSINSHGGSIPHQTFMASAAMMHSYQQAGVHATPVMVQMPQYSMRGQAPGYFPPANQIPLHNGAPHHNIIFQHHNFPNQFTTFPPHYPPPAMQSVPQGAAVSSAAQQPQPPPQSGQGPMPPVSSQPPQQGGHPGAHHPPPPQTPPNMGYAQANHVPTSGGPHSLPAIGQGGYMMPPQSHIPMYAQTQQAPQQHTQSKPKRPSRVLEIIHPDSGENVLDSFMKEKDEGKAKEAVKKDESKSNKTAEPTEDAATSATDKTAVKAAMNIRDEFQSKVSKIAAESKAELAKAADKAEDKAEVKEKSPAYEEIHSVQDSAIQMPVAQSMQAAIQMPVAQSMQVPEEPENPEVKQKEVSAAPELSDPQNAQDVIHSDEKPDATTPETPTKRLEKALEPVSPTPLPETPSRAGAAKEDVTQLSKPAAVKKSGPQKRAEINRKTTGSEMDAFIGAAAVPEEKEKEPELTESEKDQPDSTVSSSTSSLTTSTTEIPKQTIFPCTEGPLPDDANKEVEEPEETAEESSLQPCTQGPSEDPPESVPKENGTSSTSGSQIKLKYTYKDDQWSPINIDGKKQYDRDFLIQLQRDPISMTKPKNLPSMDIIKDKAMQSKISFGNSDFTPPFGYHQGSIKQTVKQGPGGSLTKRIGRDNRRGAGGQPPGGQPARQIVLQEKNVELHTTKNAWKPDKLKSGKEGEAGGEDDPLLEVKRAVMAILNKLTPQKFDNLIKKFNEIVIDTEKKLEATIGLIFEKAVDESGFAVEYAKMCKELSTKNVRGDNGELINFRKMLIHRCQREFMETEGVNRENYEEQLKNAPSEEKRKEIKEEFDEKERQCRRRSIGNTRFIGEMYKLNMLTVRIMHECIYRLLKESPDEEALECLCRLVTTVGKQLETATNGILNGTGKKQEIVSLDVHFNSIDQIIKGRKTSSRIRFLLQDLVDLRKNNWVPRKNQTTAGPKKLEEIHKDIEREKTQQQLADLAATSQYTGSRSLGVREGGSRDNYRNRGSKGPSSRTPNDEGWNSVTKAAKNMQNEKIDTSMFKVSNSMKDHDIFSSRPAFAQWGRGSGSAPRPKDQVVVSSNRFGALSGSGEQRSSSPGPYEGRRMASRSVGGNIMPGRGSRGPSAENERQNAVQAVKNFGKMNNGPGASKRPTNITMSFGVGEDNEEDIEANQIRELHGEQLAGDPDKLELRLNNIIDEYCSAHNLKETILEVKESCLPSNMSKCVGTWINHVLETKGDQRTNLGCLMVVLINERLLMRSQIVSGLSEVLSVAEELIHDIPKFWEYIGEIIIPLFDCRVCSLALLRESAKSLDDMSLKGKYVEAVLRRLKEKVSEHRVAEWWYVARMDWAEFVPQNEISAFIAEHKLEYTQRTTSTSSAVNRNGPSSSTSLPPDQLRAVLQKMLPEKNIAKVTEFIDSYLKGREPDNTFIRILTKAVTYSSLNINQKPGNDPSQQNIVVKINADAFDYHMPLLKKYLDGNPVREKEAIYGLQSLMCELEHPSKILGEIFETMTQNDIISEEAFLEWEKCQDPAEQEGKGVAIKCTTHFFSWLRENHDYSD